MAVSLADAPHAFERAAVTDVPAQGVAGVGRIGDQAPAPHELRRLADEARLGINRVQFEVFGHGVHAAP
ncbi:MAG: hypothetical protein PVSMB6_20230 [Steroidobacteraceae bacterium]